MLTIETKSRDETICLGKKLSRILKAQDVVVLEGPLGTGKTTFVKGILKGFGFKGRVLSPSFTLVREYKNKNKQFYHIDLYRVDKKGITTFGIEDYLYAPQSITLIEWGEKITYLLGSFIKVKFMFAGKTRRTITFSLIAPAAKKLKFVNNNFRI